ncbi:MAG TPA: aminofutalosine synthase MqnE [Candidatus Deferrimicrobiaceae bacterium]|jgi:aminodeoxyfutalosine synthase|nr:aminofutalosine synthase MqnE [Candidatus Deferrimicrobiaceae bacterium]
MEPSLERIRDKVSAGVRMSEEDALALFRTRDIHAVGEMADLANRRVNGDRVYFIVNRHINPTNICVNRCKFCAFGKGKEEPLAYTMTMDEILVRAEEGRSQNATELHIVGGLHPDLPFDFYLRMLRTLRERFPEMHIQAFTAVEIDYFSRITGLPLAEVIRLLKEAGLGSLPGGGAEIFAPEVRNRICPEKITGDRWLEVMEEVHAAGLRSNATMLYGHVETLESRVDHMRRLRELQDRTGGFQSFIPLAFHPKNTEIAKGYTTGLADLLSLAVGRIYLDNFRHVKSFWIMVGPKIAQISLHFGVDDIDGTVVEEKITHAAGAQAGQEMTVAELVTMIRQAGKIPVERDTLYNVVREWPETAA